MKTSKAILILLLLATPFTWLGCNDDDGPITLGPLYLGEAKDYVYFKEGSWWVYKNSISKEIDSSVVISDYLELKTYGCSENQNSLQKEDYRLNIKSKTICRNLEFTLRRPWGCQPLNLLNSYFEVFMDYECGLPKGTSVTFYYPFDLEKSGNSGQDVFFIQLHDSLQVQNQWYYDVAEFEVDIDYSQNGRKGVYYWARNAGLIKREKHSHVTQQLEESWELIDYNVIQ
jgi:hypothetical protein